MVDGLIRGGLTESEARRQVAELLGIDLARFHTWLLGPGQTGSAVTMAAVAGEKKLQIPPAPWFGPAEVLIEALDAVTDGSLITDASRHILHANPAFTHITGYKSSEILGGNCAFLQGPETDPDTIERMRHAFDSGQPFWGDVLNYRKDGTPFWNSLIVLPVKDFNGQTTHYVSVQRNLREDIDHLTNVERRLYETETKQRTGELLLGVVASLNGWSTLAEACQAIADAILIVNQTDLAVVALKDRHTNDVVITAVTGNTPGQPSIGDTIPLTEAVELAALQHTNSPALMDRDTGPWVRNELDKVGAEALIATPFHSSHDVEGFLLGYWTEGLPTDAQRSAIQERLSRLSDLAAAALNQNPPEEEPTPGKPTPTVP
ncbi:PAS domain-containing protein [Subtercola boreus]|uniref:PAS domain-containing protein n=1 Tax=Subtercola boreus TaxID=120213 RepID=UPI001558CDB1|nr:PAS domain-containing protein [Subtercola boreus]